MDTVTYPEPRVAAFVGQHFIPVKISVKEKPDVAASFDDAQLANFQRFAPFIVEAELGRTGVTDASIETLSQFKNLRALHLEGTAISGRTLARLSSLSQLTYLNLSATKVTSDTVAPLKSIPNLRHVYLFNTPAEPASAAEIDLRSTQ